MININKKIKLSASLILSAVMLFGLFAFATPASAITCNSVTFTGTVTVAEPPVHARFEYSTNSSTVSNGGGTPTAVQVFNTVGNYPMQQFVSGLTENTTYHYRIVVTSSQGTVNGAIVSFTTPPCQQTQNPTVNLTANPSSIQSGDSSTLSWSSTNATSCSASWTTSNATSGSKVVFPTSTTTYNITCSNSSGSANDSATVNVNSQQLNPTVHLTANPSSIQSGQSSTLSWISEYATSCSASWTSSNATSGSKVVYPTYTTTYNITCTNNTGSANSSATVFVGQIPNLVTVNLTADDTDIDSGDSTILRWSSNNADTCNASGGTNGWSGNRNLSGTFDTGSLTSTRTYSITCSNNTGSANDSVTVRVNDNNEEDISVDISADDTDIEYGDNTIIRWDSDNADDCRASSGSSGWSGDRDLSGSFRTGSLTDDTTYRIRCTNDNGDSDDDSVTVRVNDRNDEICRDTSASNYLGSLPCRYIQVNNQPTVILTADSTNIAFNATTTIRWSTTNATSCNASGGSVGWAGAKSIGPGSFFTGSLTGSRTYVITCSNNVGSATDSVTVTVRGQVLGVATTPSAYLVVNSSVDRNRPIVPTLDNTNPCPGDEINYTLTYQNIGNGSVRNLVLRIDLPLEVTYLSSNPSNPTMSGNTLIFNLGTLAANKSGTVTVRVLVRDNVQAGTNLNFPATLNYVDPSGLSQSVSANVSANVCGTVLGDEDVALSASVFGAGFLPNSILGWLLLIILILLLILLAKYLFGQSFQKKTVTTFNQPLGKKTTTTTTQ